jgi:glycosyltransferase involved in cell wall biosynthesis
MNPLISVVIPTYNHAHFLGRALQSVIQQSYYNWEAIVVDNNSKDDTDEVIARFRNERITPLKINNHGVIAASRNLGIRNAKGEWVAFLDSDDWWRPEKLSVCVENINENVDLMYHDLAIRRDKATVFGRKVLRGRELTRPVLFDLLVGGNCVINSSVVVRRNLLGRVNGMSEDSEMIAAEDFNTWLRIAQLTENFVYIPKSLGYYTYHSQGISRKDMSIPERAACRAFLSQLNDSQRDCFDTRIEYASARYLFCQRDYERSAPKLKNSLRRGTLSIKLKSLYMLTRALLKL